MTRLPRSLDQLHDLRAARWLRESTGRQLDRFGPEAVRVAHRREWLMHVRRRSRLTAMHVRRRSA